MTAASEQLPSRERLRWQCRRGLLELDLLLDSFVVKGYGGLSDEDKAQFVELLDYPDQLLQAWLLGQAAPDDEAMARLVEIIRRSY